jgi:outer membrane receptor protein involved in Fe transport
LALRAAAYTGFRQPTLNELYRPFVVFPITTQANAQLENERLEGYEAGLELTPRPGLALTVTAFDNRLKDAIANVTLNATTRQRQNVDAIRARGVELGARAAVGTVAFDGSLSWTDAQVQGSGIAAALDGLRPAQVPKLAASGTLAWTPQPGWRLAATLRHVGAQFEDDLESDVLPAATTLDAFAQVPLGAGVGLVLRGENLWNERILTRNQGGSIDLGNPRTIWAGLRMALR